MSSQTNHLHTITPSGRSQESLKNSIRHLFEEIWRSRKHIRIVFKENFRASSAGTGFGALWNYVLPLVPLTIYWFLARFRVFPSFEGVDGAVFITYGVTLWFVFAGCIQIPIQVVQSRQKDSMKTAFPLIAAIMAGFANLMFETSVRLGLVAVIILATQSWPHWGSLFLPLAMLPALFFFGGIGLLLSLMNVIYKDVSRVTTIVLQYGIFVSGVLFPLAQGGLLSFLNQFNPFFVFIEASRFLAFQGELMLTPSYIVMSMISVLVFVKALRMFYVMEYRIRGLV